jgi:hypothetical protein
MPPKEALVSPWPGRYLNYRSRKENLSIFLKLSAICRRRLEDVKGSLCSSASPADFGGMNLPLSRTTRKAFPPVVEFFPSCLSQGGNSSNL